MVLLKMVAKSNAPKVVSFGCDPGIEDATLRFGPRIYLKPPYIQIAAAKSLPRRVVAAINISSDNNSLLYVSLIPVNNQSGLNRIDNMREPGLKCSGLCR